MDSGGTIFGLVNGKLIEMNAGPYLSEDVLQTYLEQHAKLLGGEQIDPTSPRRWLLVAREMSVPDRLDGKERWSLDHLFVDQDAIPTLVEVKKSSNTEIRRQIVGQLLDYAANGSQYWTIGKIREAFLETCKRREVLERPLFRELFSDADSDDAELDGNIETFWNDVQNNMASGRVRLLFVSDVIPTELRRIIEFLNAQMTPAQVMGVEIRQYVSSEMTAFVPRVFPQTVSSQNTQGSITRSGPDSIQVLIAAAAIPVGAKLRFFPNWGQREELDQWLAQNPGAIEAEWQPIEKWSPLRWRDGQAYSTTGLARKIYELAGKPKDTLRGPDCWTYDGKTLLTIANAIRSGAQTQG